MVLRGSLMIFLAAAQRITMAALRLGPSNATTLLVLRSAFHGKGYLFTIFVNGKDFYVYDVSNLHYVKGVLDEFIGDL